MIWPGFYLLLASICAVNGKLVVVILREETGPSVAELRHNIRVNDEIVHVVPGDINVKGGWTLLPLFPKLFELHPTASWFAFLGQTTGLNWTELVDLTQRLQPDREWFIGYGLFDREATIVHHFAFHHDPTAFKYPHLDAGILLSRPVIQRVCAKIAQQRLPKDFAIDVQHELALYLMDGVNLTHSPASMCLHYAAHCATWIRPFEPCGPEVAETDVYLAVKTCQKFHADRLPVVRQTWGRNARYFSDVRDETIPTVSLGVANTETGHCSKTMAIIGHLASKDHHAWYVIADDDTILGVGKLRRLLSCYDPSRPLLIGQKYGWAAGQSYGYDYITGGGGMVLSRAAVRLIAKNNRCRCPTPDTPDDMWLGACAATLGISTVHFSGFHQARPDDYPPELLETQFAVSFHKHWMLDPLQVYEHWFDEDLEHSDYSLLDGAQQPNLFHSSSRQVLPDEL